MSQQKKQSAGVTQNSRTKGMMAISTSRHDMIYPLIVIIKAHMTDRRAQEYLQVVHLMMQRKRAEISVNKNRNKIV